MADVTNLPNQKVNVKCFKGSDLSFVLTYTDSAGDPINLSSYTANWVLKRNTSDASADLELDETDGIDLGGAAGTVTVTVTAAQSALLDGEYIHALDLTSPTGDIVTVADGMALFIAKASTT